MVAVIRRITSCMTLSPIRSIVSVLRPVLRCMTARERRQNPGIPASRNEISLRRVTLQYGCSTLRMQHAVIRMMPCYVVLRSPVLRGIADHKPPIWSGGNRIERASSSVHPWTFHESCPRMVVRIGILPRLCRRNKLPGKWNDQPLALSHALSASMARSSAIIVSLLC